MVLEDEEVDDLAKKKLKDAITSAKVGSWRADHTGAKMHKGDFTNLANTLGAAAANLTETKLLTPTRADTTFEMQMWMSETRREERLERERVERERREERLERERAHRDHQNSMMMLAMMRAIIPSTTKPQDPNEGGGVSDWLSSVCRKHTFESPSK
jgi:uncharacterized membrane protein YqiK